MQVDAESKPSAIGPPFTGHFRVIADTPRGLQTFQPSPNIKKEAGQYHEPTENAVTRAYKAATEQEKVEFNYEIGRNIYDRKGRDITADLKDKPQANGDAPLANGALADESVKKAIEERAKEPTNPVYCNSCAIECRKGRFHYTKPLESKDGAAASLDVCAPCFWNERLSARTASSDFVWLDGDVPTATERDPPWTDAELLLLLEALQRFDDNWNQIADYVGTRTREECVVKFLQLEIEDKYLEPEATGAGYGDLDQGRVPFSQADNPVLSVLGYLASLSEPPVAAAAAGRSIEEMAKLRRKRLESGLGEGNGSLRNEDSMEMDTSANDTQIEKAEDPIPKDLMRDVANTTFATAAARAAALASNEEREMTRLVSAAVNVTLEKMELKLQQFSEMEAALHAERRDLERAKQQLFLDRVAFRKRVLETQEALKNASLRGGEAGARMASEVMVGSENTEKLGFVREESAPTAIEPPSGGVNYEI